MAIRYETEVAGVAVCDTLDVTHSAAGQGFYWSIAKKGIVIAPTLPAGVTLTGIFKNGVSQSIPFAVVATDKVTGTIANTGAYPVTITLKNQLVADTVAVTITTGSQSAIAFRSPLFCFYWANGNKFLYVSSLGGGIYNIDGSLHMGLEVSLAPYTIGNTASSYSDGIILDGDILFIASLTGLYTINLTAKTYTYSASGLSIGYNCITASPTIIYQGTYQSGSAIPKYNRATGGYIGLVASIGRAYSVYYIGGYVYYSTGGAFYKFDVATETVSASFGAYGIYSMEASGTTLYLGFSGSVKVWDTSTDTLTTSIAVTGIISGMTVVGSYLYVLSVSGYVYQIEIATNTIISTYTLIGLGVSAVPRAAINYNPITNALYISTQATIYENHVINIIYL